MHSPTFLTKEIDNKSVIWFKNTNQYVVLENYAKQILEAIDLKTSKSKIADTVVKDLQVSAEEALRFVEEIKQDLYDENLKKVEATNNRDILGIDGVSFKRTKYYQVNNLVFKVDFQTEHEEFLIHPKFSHLETRATEKINFNYKVFSNNGFTHFWVDEDFVGSWSRPEIHYFQGKFSMYLTQHIHQIQEKDWLGVFHASAVSDSKKAILFLGDSGNGKSTSLALLQANGFTCLADDFVPIDANHQNVYAFPSGISIKKNSVPVLSKLYPELQNAAEYHFKTLNKIVRFLPPNNYDYKKNLPCNDLVFIKYEAKSDLQFNRIAKVNAFEKLVPDSWLSPIEHNASVFLDWFSNLNCYELIYSDNKKMLDTVAKLFKDEL